MVEVVLENLRGGAGHATIHTWYFEEGDAVSKGDEIVELSLEDGTVTVTAPAPGILAEVYYDEGETVEVGEALCLIEDEESFQEDIEKEEER